MKGDGHSERHFQCSDDPFDVKIRGDAIVCGLRNGDVELWDRRTLERKAMLREQQGSVQVNKKQLM